VRGEERDREENEKERQTERERHTHTTHDHRCILEHSAENLCTHLKNVDTRPGTTTYL
jgi:hypothetical protein